MTVLYNEAVQSEDQQVPAQLYYKLAQSDQFRICRIDFRKEAGYFNYLWERLQFYGILLKKQQEAQDKTEELIEACRKYGVQQIEQWAQQTAQLSQKVKSYDLTVFKEVERANLAKFGNILANFVKFGEIRPNLTKVGQIWRNSHELLARSRPRSGPN